MCINLQQAKEMGNSVSFEFELFSETARSYKPKMSIRSNGTLAFTSGAVSKFNLAKFKFVQLYYDRANKAIGIKPTMQEGDGAHVLHAGKTGAFLSATRFLSYYDLMPKQTQRIDVYWDEELGMVIAKL